MAGWTEVVMLLIRSGRWPVDVVDGEPMPVSYGYVMERQKPPLPIDFVSRGVPGQGAR